VLLPPSPAPPPTPVPAAATGAANRGNTAGGAAAGATAVEGATRPTPPGWPDDSRPPGSLPPTLLGLGDPPDTAPGTATTGATPTEGRGPLSCLSGTSGAGRAIPGTACVMLTAVSSRRPGWNWLRVASKGARDPWRVSKACSRRAAWVGLTQGSRTTPVWSHFLPAGGGGSGRWTSRPGVGEPSGRGMWTIRR
jgi:hypothetical protein